MSTVTDTERTIITAAANLLREKGIELARNERSSPDERDAANACLLACVNADAALSALGRLDIPF